MSLKPIFGSLSLMASALSTGHVFATNPSENTPSLQPRSAEACVALQSSSDRLACYDAFFQPSNVQNTVQPTINATEIPATSLLDTITQIPATISANPLIAPAPEFDTTSSLLDQRWELAENSKLGTWQIRGYQPVYILPAMWTSEKNSLPYSPNPTNQVTEKQDLNSVEAKFQISFKTKAIEDLFGNNGDVWFGYTQSSRWQVYNAENSRPFRETNYEPEASLMFRTNYSVLGLHGRLLGATFNHQSNGRSDPFSRSWNRVMLNLGFERDNFALMLRPWYRLEEERKDDNNPDIKDYMGRGDLTAFYKHNDHNFSLMLRHSLKGGDDNRGAVQFDWAFPLSGSLRGHLQLFNGYGESLIDYNHKATYVGLGVSLLNWF